MIASGYTQLDSKQDHRLMDDKASTEPLIDWAAESRRKGNVNNCAQEVKKWVVKLFFIDILCSFIQTVTITREENTHTIKWSGFLTALKEFYVSVQLEIKIPFRCIYEKLPKFTFNNVTSFITNVIYKGSHKIRK